MRRLVLPGLFFVLTMIPVAASEPGQPLDSSDWVIVEPGLVCVDAVYPCSLGSCQGGFDRAIDTEGYVYHIAQVTHPTQPTCGPCTMYRTWLVRFDGTSEEGIAYLDSRCVSETGVPGGHYTDNLSVHKLLLDLTNGSMLLVTQNWCCTNGEPCPYAGTPRRLQRIDGFTTLFEVLQTYDPPAAELGFRVPYMPEGFERVDWFDSYYGDLATVGDWSQARPLQCGYPATSPSVGDYLTVADMLADPVPGTGRYYVTAVNFQGERRYGRKANRGQLSGRDPAVLPACFQGETRR